MQHITLIMNPKAGNQKLHDQLDFILEKLQTIAPEVAVHYTQQEEDGFRFVQEVAPYTDLLIIAGGDGTVHTCINGLASLSRRPPLAILPGGTCNDFARTLGYSQDPVEAIDQIMKRNERKIDVAQHNDSYFLNFWGIGLITQVSNEIEPEMKKKWGRLAYYLSAWKQFDQSESFEVEIQSDDYQYQGPAQMVLIGNGAYVGGLKAYFPLSSVEDGQLDVLVFKTFSLEAITAMFSSHITRDQPQNESLDFFRTKEIKISTTPAQQIDCDGEKTTKTPSLIRTLPGHLRMWVGDDYLNPINSEDDQSD
ncbi:diacylglycerol kinase family lipid kinase [Hazenella sp. IB182357]|uniref:Diacylglycerol kinase family lipid kinase n=1 Tax=Polycladospora coralii TaxID=2771432 RepID=A0A926N6Z0_9BACL|nr:diacylglycerol kinase family protein [Polycladospora coralii]MBD1370941.1 diacylglycerol kinase family lipid kinase [Polycladospora coralii]MBS7529880.1 diacylglycerol kinase family lipid kinase [Polycladospora coralii]